jgi:hypothetical protein
MTGFGLLGRFGGCDKVCEMDAQLLMIIVVIPLDLGVVNCSFNLLELTVSP